ncbi:WhiB family transcriptional regulator [Streptosporangium saharense]|uniref:WhiB family transcriptional regulator n=1 Tax=Streptosporangium saharense TaxID=1706840 RepID=UPI00344AFC38
MRDAVRPGRGAAAERGPRRLHLDAEEDVMRLRDRYGAWGLDTPPAESWRDRAACRSADDPEIFFPKVSAMRGARGAETRAYAAAQQVCARCPVQQECRAYALDRDEQYGMWGGMTPGQRRRLLNQMKAAG